MSTHQWVFITLFTMIAKFILTKEMQTLKKHLWVIAYTEYHLMFSQFAHSKTMRNEAYKAKLGHWEQD